MDDLTTHHYIADVHALLAAAYSMTQWLSMLFRLS